jgi:hypothetical protein
MIHENKIGSTKNPRPKKNPTGLDFLLLEYFALAFPQSEQANEDLDIFFLQPLHFIILIYFTFEFVFKN